MVQKINAFGEAVNGLLEKGYSQVWIARMLKVKKQWVNYWAKNPLRFSKIEKEN